MSTVTINGRIETLPDDPDALLVDVLRDKLGLTGTKLVCGAGVCGACTVLLDGAPVVSCLMPATAAAGKQSPRSKGSAPASCIPCRRRSWRSMPCNAASARRASSSRPRRFTTAGGATKGAAAPSREEIGAALSGHLCRCGAYDNILRAVAEACAGRFDGDRAGGAARRGAGQGDGRGQIHRRHPS